MEDWWRIFPLSSFLSQTPSARAGGGTVQRQSWTRWNFAISVPFPKSRKRKVCPESGRGNRWLQLCLQQDGSLANSSFLHFNHVFSMPWRKLSNNSPVCLLLRLPWRAPCLLLGHGVREGHQAWTPSHLIPEIQGGTTKATPSALRIPSLSSSTKLPDPRLPSKPNTGFPK